MSSNPNKPITHPITEDVFLYTKREDYPTISFIYEIECARLNRLNFRMDFTGSENFLLENGELIIDTIIEPFQRVKIGRISIQDPNKPANLKNSYNWNLEDPDPVQLQQILKEEKEKIDIELNLAPSLGFGNDSYDIHDIQKICLEKNVKYIDPEFPPDDTSLYKYDENDELVRDGKYITWKRPEDFMDGSYAVFDAGIEPSDIRQGSLANCWFMCALASLAEFPPLIEKLFLPESRRIQTCGAYQIKLCIHGQWRIVTLDDFFPCFPGSGPAYSRSHGNELWVLLLEKAYAKFHNSYAAIKMGYAYEALIDLTGAPYKTIRIDEEDGQELINNGKLWQYLLEWDEKGYLLSASTPGEDIFTETGEKPQKDGIGLVAGHAYTVLRTINIKHGGHKLLMLRNPWGNFEWSGDWGDESELWTPEIEEEIGGRTQADDGTFWMCFEDFCQHFFSINIVMVRHKGEDVNMQLWKEERRKVTLTMNPETKEISTPMYKMKIKQKSQVYFSTHQEDERCRFAKPYIDIGVTILKIINNNNNNNIEEKKDDNNNNENDNISYEIIASSGNQADRQNQTEAILEPGEYIIVPTTTGCRFSHGYDKQNKSNQRKNLFNDNGTNWSGEAEAALNIIFDRLDVDMDGLLNQDDLGQFLLLSEDAELPNNIYQWLINNFDSKKTKNITGLTADGFRDAYLYMWKQSGRDPEIIWRDLIYMGFNNNLELLNSRTIVLAIHSENKFTLDTVQFDPEIYEEAMELPIKAWGNCTEFAEGSIKLYIRKSGYGGISFAAENMTENIIIFGLDCSASKNVVTHIGPLVNDVEIPINETKILMHLMPDEIFEPWSWSYRASISFK